MKNIKVTPINNDVAWERGCPASLPKTGFQRRPGLHLSQLFTWYMCPTALNCISKADSDSNASLAHGKPSRNESKGCYQKNVFLKKVFKLLSKMELSNSST